jgi:isopentenyl-diphosphate delta-isomerase
VHAQRKQEHLRICLEEDTRSSLATGLADYALLHCALPECSLAEVDTATTFLGHRVAAPILISAMTGGAADTGAVNRNLAGAAQALNLPICLGSLRAGLEEPRLMASYQVRDVAPDVPLFANLGAVQLNYGYGPVDCRRAVEAVGADALVLHLNPLQEALQPEGNTAFAQLLTKIAAVCAALACPVVVKEVGWGIGPAVAERLAAAGVAAIDVAGAGGTSWSKVEGLRAPSAADAEVAQAFADWGLPTAGALLALRTCLPTMPLIASGGIANGVDVAKCLALGADLVGLAHALLAPALQSADAVQRLLEVIIRQLRIAMFCTGSPQVPLLDASHLVRRS